MQQFLLLRVKIKNNHTRNQDLRKKNTKDNNSKRKETIEKGKIKQCKKTSNNSQIVFTFTVFQVALFNTKQKKHTHEVGRRGPNKIEKNKKTKNGNNGFAAREGHLSEKHKHRTENRKKKPNNNNKKEHSRNENKKTKRDQKHSKQEHLTYFRFVTFLFSIFF